MDEVVKTEEVTPTEETTETVTEVAQPGEKTDSALLLKRLQEERDKRRELEAKVQALETPRETFSDEGRLLESKIAALEAKLSAKEQSEVRSSVESQYPQLKDKNQEFEEYMQANPGLSIQTAAKGFLIENDLMPKSPSRKGMETGGGARVPTRNGRTEDEVAELRKTNYRQYEKELAAGTLWN